MGNFAGNVPRVKDSSIVNAYSMYGQVVDSGEGRLGGAVESFLYPAFKRLQHNLGKSDAVSEFTQLALEFFLSELTTSDNPAERLELVSANFRIRVNSYSEPFVRNRKAHLDILAVYEIAEEFFKSLRRESQVPWSGRRDGEDYLSWYWRNLPTDITNDPRATILRDLFDYYRLVRNEFMHSKEKTEGLAKSANELNSLKKHIPEYTRLNAPAAYENIGFDDVVLFTRVTKDLAEFLCKALTPGEENLFGVLEFCYKEETGKNLHALKRFNDPERLKKSFLSMLKRYFSLSDRDASYVIESLLRGC